MNTAFRALLALALASLACACSEPGGSEPSPDAELDGSDELAAEVDTALEDEDAGDGLPDTEADELDLTPDLPDDGELADDPDGVELDTEPDELADLADDGPDLRNCGNGELDPGEQCDDGNDLDDDFCLSTCRFACGDGVVQPVERCDTAIPATAAGACPTACISSDPCSPARLVGEGCSAQCVVATIASCAFGDGCCAPSCNQLNDDDCDAVCNNGMLELGESCDPSSSCPQQCLPPAQCVSATLVGAAASCDALCRFDVVSACTPGDGCCPAGCAGDPDCSASCGDGNLDVPQESCDPPSTCPSSCADTDNCTADLVSGAAASCNLVCTHVPIVACVTGDGCCPSGCTQTVDGDCAPDCGNGIVEGLEACDDGNFVAGDGCSPSCALELAAFRPYDIDLRDPHIFVDVSILGCRDMTDYPAPFGVAPSINELISQSLTTDSGGSGYLDLSILLVFRPFSAAPSASADLDLGGGGCTAPLATTSCFAHPAIPFQRTRYLNSPATPSPCLAADPAALGAYSPGVAEPPAPCFLSEATELQLDLGGIVIPLQYAQVAATYLGSPPDELVSGLIVGFVAETTANATLLPAEIPLVGGLPLSALLPGGQGSCAPHDDRDLGPDGATLGWWFHLNFVAEQVPFVD